MTTATITALNFPPLPLVQVNHVSYAVRSPLITARFFEKVLGFKRLRRPLSFETTFDGAWLCGLGMEIHLIQETENAPPSPPSSPTASNNNTLDPRANHISFLTENIDDVILALKCRNVAFQEFAPDNIRQLFFKEPASDILIEISDNPKCWTQYV